MTDAMAMQHKIEIMCAAIHGWSDVKEVYDHGNAFVLSTVI